MIRVGVYIDYSNVYSGARDAFILDQAPGYRGNINPSYLAKRVALQSPGTGAPRRDTHELAFAKVFRGAPDPGREPVGALMEAKRAAQWESWGVQVYRHTLDYGQGWPPVEKGVDVRIATEMITDCATKACDLIVVVSADKDFRYALLKVRDMGMDVEVATWQAIPGGRSVGRIELRPERPDDPEVPCHLLGRSEFNKFEDKIDYRSKPIPAGWSGPTPGH